MTAAIDWAEVEGIATAAEAGGGTVGVSLIAPNGERYRHNGERRFRAASTVKIPIMGELYRQIAQGTHALDEPYVLRQADITPGSGVLLHLHTGLQLTINDLLYLMISISDNTATNILIDLVGMDRVNATMRDLGMRQSTLGRKMKGSPAEPGDPENWATPDEYAQLIQRILVGDVVSRQACEEMRAMLEKQQNTRRIARYLPEEPGISWGSKTGSIKGVTNDVGFITTERGTLILSIFCEDLADQHVGEQVIGNISRAAMTATGIVTPLTTS